MKNQQRETRDLYQQVTDDIIEALESGVMPWIKPWNDAEAERIALRLPYNGESGRHYSGINILLLWAAQIKHGFKQAKWLTFNGIAHLGGTIRKGEKSTRIILYRPMETEEKDTEGNVIFDENGEAKIRQYAVIRGIPVFNIEQCDGIEPHLGSTEQPIIDESDAMTLINTLPKKMGVSLFLRPQGKAFYSPSRDCIVMPEVCQFEEIDRYYATLLHESAHASGHSSRLNRIGITNNDGFGSSNYAFEELIAELTSAFMCAHVGIDNISQNAAYLNSWIKTLKSDKKAIFRATSQARTATDYLMQHLTVPHLAQAC
ncbi:ArdC family protein [Pasteurella testudinis]|uniref:ArdC family protein n=1 Tax=Pasteurella testudinis TaxID=761 RepID=UPI00405A2DBB